MNNPPSKKILDLVERFGEHRFIRKLDEIAEKEFLEWSDKQVCSVCGDKAVFLNWGLFRRHFCIPCAKDGNWVEKNDPIWNEINSADIV
jgi:hypothetical protein